MEKISVIIMTLNAELYIRNMLEMLKVQTVAPDEIIVADSESDDQTLSIVKEYKGTKIINIKRNEFDHGGSRDKALRVSNGYFVLFLTQDAQIGNNHYIENILKPFENNEIAMVCGRQIAKNNAPSYEKLIREFNYPDRSMIKSKEDIVRLGIKAYYMSDVCSAYRRDLYLKIGGFKHPLNTNEDMLIAATALRSGYKIAYESSAFVFHSHVFTLKQEFIRNKNVAVFMKKHKDDLGTINVDSEGIALVRYVSERLLKDHKYIDFLKFGFVCVSKYMGNKYGKYIAK